MKRLILFFYFGVLIYAKPSYPVHPAVGAIYKGPNSETIIEGPDGSVITAEAEGGSVAVKGEAAAVEAALAPAPVEAALAPAPIPAVPDSGVINVSPTSLASAPIIVEETPVVDQVSIAQAPVLTGTVVAVEQKNIASLEGASGSILRHGEDAVISGPASTTIKEGGVVASIPKPVIDTVVKQVVPIEPFLGPQAVGAEPVVDDHFYREAQRKFLAQQSAIASSDIAHGNIAPQFVGRPFLNGAHVTSGRQQLDEARLLNAAQEAYLSNQRANHEQLGSLPNVATVASGHGLSANGLINGAQLPDNYESLTLDQAAALNRQLGSQLYKTDSLSKAERHAIAAQAINSGYLSNSHGLVNANVNLETPNVQNSDPNGDGPVISQGGRVISEQASSTPIDLGLTTNGLVYSTPAQAINSGYFAKSDGLVDAYGNVQQNLPNGIPQTYVNSGGPVISQGGQVLDQSASTPLDPGLTTNGLVPSTPVAAFNSGYFANSGGLVDANGNVLQNFRNDLQTYQNSGGPDISQGRQVADVGLITTGVASSTPAPAIASSTLRPPPSDYLQPPAQINGVPTTLAHSSQGILPGHIISSTPGPLPGYLASQTPRPLPGYLGFPNVAGTANGYGIVSSAPLANQPDYLSNTNTNETPIISRPTAVLKPIRLDDNVKVTANNVEDRGPIVVQLPVRAPQNEIAYNGGLIQPEVQGQGAITASELTAWQASVAANGHIAGEAVLPKQVYRSFIH